MKTSMVPQTGAPFPVTPPEPIVSLPWGHNLTLLTKLKDSAVRLWYAGKAVEHGWSRNVLALQIESGLHNRQGNPTSGTTNRFPPLPPPPR